jgi:hypothetical protein
MDEIIAGVRLAPTTVRRSLVVAAWTSLPGRHCLVIADV